MNNLTIYKQGNKITHTELCDTFRKYNEGVNYAGDKREPLKALVLLTADSFRVEVAEEDRLYLIKSNNKMFYSDTLGYSCFGFAPKWGDRLENELDTGKGVEGIVLLEK